MVGIEIFVLLGSEVSVESVGLIETDLHFQNGLVRSFPCAYAKEHKHIVLLILLSFSI